MSYLVSIILSTRDRCEALAQTLASVQALTIPADVEVELILVDNGSTDATLDVMRALNVTEMEKRIVEEPRPGVSHARNAGMQAAQGEVLLFIDDDLRFPDMWLDSMIEPIRSGRADVVQGRIEPADYLQRPWMNTTDRLYRLAQVRSFDPEQPTLTTASVAVARACMPEGLQFDTYLGPGHLGFEEDRLFGRVLHQHGARFCLSEHSPAVHCCDESRLRRDSLLRDAEKIGRSTAHVRYHWDHHFNGRKQSTGWIYRRIVQAYAKLWRRRLTRWTDWRYEEGIARWEFRGVQQIAMLRQLLIERTKTRRYARPNDVTPRPEADERLPSSTSPSANDTPSAHPSAVPSVQ